LLFCSWPPLNIASRRQADWLAARLEDLPLVCHAPLPGHFAAVVNRLLAAAAISQPLFGMRQPGLPGCHQRFAAEAAARLPPSR
jgi:hypothetical protein